MFDVSLNINPVATKPLAQPALCFNLRKSEGDEARAIVRATSNIRLPITTRSAPDRDSNLWCGVIHQPETPPALRLRLVSWRGYVDTPYHNLCLEDCGHREAAFLILNPLPKTV